MRKGNSPVLTSSNDDVLAPFVKANSQNIADARQRAAPYAIKIGHPNGQVKIPKYRGFFYGQRELADGTSTVVNFYAPNDSDSNPIADFKAGDAAMVRFSNDTQPGHWIYVSHTPADDTVNIATSLPLPCSNVINPGGNGTKFWWEGLYPCSTTPPATGSSSNPYTYLTVGRAPNNPARKTTPRRAAQPVGLPYAGDLWQSITDDEAVFRFEGDSAAGTGKWYAQSGPTSGTFLMRKFRSAVTKGKVVYEVKTTGTSTANVDMCDIADNTNPDCYGRVLGVVYKDRLTNQYGLVQVSGDIVFSHSYNHGQPLFLDTLGNVSATPTSTIGSFAQQIVVAGNSTSDSADSYWNIALGVPIRIVS